MHDCLVCQYTPGGLTPWRRRAERGGEHVTKYNDGKSQLYSSCAVVANERACVSQSAAHGQARVRTRGRLSTVQTIAAFTAELLLQPLASGGSTVILTATAFSVS